MSRIYTASTIIDGKVVTPDDFNMENQQLASAVNRNLDGHNFPCSSITAVKLSGRTLNDDQDPLIISRGVWSDYFSMWIDGGGPTTALATLDLRTDGALGGWNNFADPSGLDIGEATKTFALNTDGMLEGALVIDWERRYGYHDAGTTRGGHEDWTNFGLFIDGQLVKETGHLWPRRETRWLPFFIALPAGDHTLEIRWQASRADNDSGNPQYDSPFSVYQIYLSMKHIKR